MCKVALVWMMLAAGVALAQGFAEVAFSVPSVRAAVPAYTVKADLANVTNVKTLPILTEAQRTMLTTQAFVARPTRSDTLAAIYADNARQGIPTFITADVMLQAGQALSDQSLREVEQTKLLPALKLLCRKLLAANLKALNGSPTLELRAALQRNAACVAVPLLLLGDKPSLPADVQALASMEVARIEQHNAWTACLTDATVNYTSFVPRGHYTSSAALARYGKALHWLREAAMPVDGARNDRPLLQALLLTEQLAADKDAYAAWRSLNDCYAFYQGSTDDLSVTDLTPVLTKTFGAGEPARFDNRQKLIKVRLQLQELPRIPALPAPAADEARSFRLLPQPTAPDADMIRMLVAGRKGDALPSGLDLFAVLGSSRAAQLLDNTYQAQHDSLRKQVATLPEGTWARQRGYGWLACLRALLAPVPSGAPAFMRGAAWQDRVLMTAQGSWTALRGDSGRYEAPVAAKHETETAKPLPGYVEPQPQLYTRLAWLMRLHQTGLTQRKLLGRTEALATRFDRYVTLAERLAAISRHELENTPLSDQELITIGNLGAALAEFLPAQPGLPVANLHPAYPKALVGAAGRAAELWVIVPRQGKLYATRGAVMTSYEFARPAAQPLTADAWARTMQADKAPALPSWCRSFLPALPSPSPLPTLPVHASAPRRGKG